MGSAIRVAVAVVLACLFTTTAAATVSAPTSAVPAVPPAAPTATPDGSRYVSLAPCRLVDTRATPAGPVASRVFRVGGTGGGFVGQGGKAGGCGVPEDAVAIEASVTATAPAGTGYLRLWKAGTTEPGTTFLNYERRRSVTNTGALEVATTTGPDDLAVRTHGSPTHVVIDVQGYFAPGSTGSTFTPVAPCRLADTRDRGAVLVGSSLTIQVAGTGPTFAEQGGRAGGCGIPVDAVAVEATVTALAHPQTGYLRVWAAGSPPPGATFLNHTPGRAVTNTGTVPIATSAAEADLSVAAFGGPTDVVVDVQGYFSADPAGATYIPIRPCRALNTRVQESRLGPGDRVPVHIERTQTTNDPCPVPTTAIAAEATLTAVGPTGSGFLRAWRSDGPPPNATVLNYASGGSITNTGTVATGETVGGLRPPDVTMGNFGGSTDVVMEVLGYFELAAAPLPGAMVEDLVFASGTGRLAAEGRYVVGVDNGLRTVEVDRVTRGTTEVAPAGVVGASIAVSADGDRVARNVGDIQVHDVGSGTVDTLEGVEALSVAISADGEHVAFESTQPLPGDEADDNQADDVFVWDLAADEVVRISDNADWPWPGPVPADWIERMNPSISADGSTVAYESLFAGQAPPGQNPGRQVFLWDRASGATTHVATGGSGAYDPIGGLGFLVEGPMYPSISDDGQQVAYLSAAGAEARSTEGEVYVWDRAAGTAERVTDTGRTARRAVLSGEGDNLAFASTAALDPDDRNERRDVFRVDLWSGAAARITYSALGADPEVAGLRSDGRLVAYQHPSTGGAPTSRFRVWDVAGSEP